MVISHRLIHFSAPLTSAFGSAQSSTYKSSGFGFAQSSTYKSSAFGSAQSSTHQSSAFGSAQSSTHQSSAFGSAQSSTYQSSPLGFAIHFQLFTFSSSLLTLHSLTYLCTKFHNDNRPYFNLYFPVFAH
jgi:hypothetical protein